MLIYNATNEFVFGSELQGRGVLSTFDMLLGSSMLLTSLTAVAIGLLNLYIINKVPIFHNTFGCFWVSRTIGEVGTNMCVVFYVAPVTILQPQDITPYISVGVYSLVLLFAANACAMNQFVSANRMIAVWAPLSYKKLFSKTVTVVIITVTWIEVALVASLYYIIPCNMVGYSPQYYNYVFVKCESMERDYSNLQMIISKGCTTVCSLSLVFDCVTFFKIIQITRMDKNALNDQWFRRNVRFFFQTAMQNVTMMVALICWVIVSSSTDSDQTVLYIFEFYTRIITYLCNGLTIIIFNPEVRKVLRVNFGCGGKRDGRVYSISATAK